MKKRRAESKVHVTINMAMSADGKISSVAGESCTFTSREDKHLLAKIRSRGDAIVVGAHTAKDYITMGIASKRLQKERLRRGQSEQPIRVIVSGSLNLSPALPLFKKQISPILIACTEKAPKNRIKLFSRYARVIICGKETINLPQLIRLLVKEYQVREIVSEGGPTLNDAFFRAGLVNDYYVTICPNIVGGATALTACEGEGISHLKDAPKGRLISIRQGEKEWFLHFKFDRN
jgi:riboflavin-specific deaminase-like protein